MKLESLKSSKFEAFKGNELSRMFAITGGYCTNTYSSLNSNTPTDSYRSGGSSQVTIHDHGEQDCDLFDTMCPVGPSEGQGALVAIGCDDDQNPATPDLLVYARENFHAEPHM